MASSTPYAFATIDPFNPQALGARVPDLFTAHTNTAKLCANVSLATNSNGVCEMAILCDPFLTFIQGAGTLPGSTSMVTYPVTTAAAGFTTPTALRNLFSSWRCVGGGIRVNSIQSLTNVQGKCYYGVINPTGYIPGTNKLNSTFVTANSVSVSDLMTMTAGVPGFPSSSILNLPDSANVNLSSLTNNQVCLNFRPVTPQAYAFKTTQATTSFGTNGGSVAYAGNSVVSSTGSIIGGTIDAVSAETYGWEIMVIHIEGAPASTNILELEFIMHIEGTPAIATTFNGQAAVVADSVARSPVNLDFMSRVIQGAMSVDFSKLVGQIGRTAEGAASAISAVMSGARLVASVL